MENLPSSSPVDREDPWITVQTSRPQRSVGNTGRNVRHAGRGGRAPARNGGRYGERGRARKPGQRRVANERQRDRQDMAANRRGEARLPVAADSTPFRASDFPSLSGSSDILAPSHSAHTANLVPSAIACTPSTAVSTGVWGIHRSSVQGALPASPHSASNVTPSASVSAPNALGSDARSGESTPAPSVWVGHLPASLTNPPPPPNRRRVPGVGEVVYGIQQMSVVPRATDGRAILQDSQSPGREHLVSAIVFRSMEGHLPSRSGVDLSQLRRYPDDNLKSQVEKFLDRAWSDPAHGVHEVLHEVQGYVANRSVGDFSYASPVEMFRLHRSEVVLAKSSPLFEKRAIQDLNNAADNPSLGRRVIRKLDSAAKLYKVNGLELEQETSHNVINIGLVQRTGDQSGSVRYDCKTIDSMILAASKQLEDQGKGQLRARIFLLRTPDDLKGLGDKLDQVVIPGDQGASRFQISRSGDVVRNNPFDDPFEDDGYLKLRQDHMIPGITHDKAQDPTDQAVKETYTDREATSYAVNQFCEKHQIPLFGLCAGSWRVLEHFGGAVRHMAFPEVTRHGQSVSRTLVGNDEGSGNKPKKMYKSAWFLEHKVRILDLSALGAGRAAVESRSEIMNTSSTHWAGYAVKCERNGRYWFKPMKDVLGVDKMTSADRQNIGDKLELAMNILAYWGANPEEFVSPLDRNPNDFVHPWFVEVTDGGQLACVEGFCGYFTGSEGDYRAPVKGIQFHFEPYLPELGATKQPSSEQQVFGRALATSVIEDATKRADMRMAMATTERGQNDRSMLSTNRVTPTHGGKASTGPSPNSVAEFPVEPPK